MSQLLVGVINSTLRPLYIWNSETASNRANIPPGEVLIIQGSNGHWNIPDCSSENYFNDHHMEIRRSEDGDTLFSFWDDDDANYVIQTCPGTTYARRVTMQGASDLGNNANVVIRVQSDGLFALAAMVVE